MRETIVDERGRFSIERFGTHRPMYFAERLCVGKAPTMGRGLTVEQAILDLLNAEERR